MNIFSYQYGTVFTGRQIKEFLKELESKGYNMNRLRQYERCIDDEFYELVELHGTAAGETYKGFVRLK
jgi:hypothetical protein